MRLVTSLHSIVNQCPTPLWDDSILHLLCINLNINSIHKGEDNQAFFLTETTDYKTPIYIVYFPIGSDSQTIQPSSSLRNIQSW